MFIFPWVKKCLMMEMLDDEGYLGFLSQKGMLPLLWAWVRVDRLWPPSAYFISFDCRVSRHGPCPDYVAAGVREKNALEFMEISFSNSKYKVL